MSNTLRYHPTGWVWYVGYGYRHVFSAPAHTALSVEVIDWCDASFGKSSFVPRKTRKDEPKPRPGRWAVRDNCLLVRDDLDAFELKMRWC